MTSASDEEEGKEASEKPTGNTVESDDEESGSRGEREKNTARDSPGVVAAAWKDLGKSVKALKASSGKLEREIVRNQQDIEAVRVTSEGQRRNLDALASIMQKSEDETQRAIEKAKMEMREIIDLRLATINAETRRACAELIAECRAEDNTRTESQLE